MSLSYIENNKKSDLKEIFSVYWINSRFKKSPCVFICEKNLNLEKDSIIVIENESF